MTNEGTLPQVDVVMCTRNRAHSIAPAVRSVLASDYPNFTLTIIDQSTSSDTKDAIDAVAGADPRLHYVHTEIAGLSRAYNLGVRETSADLLAFTDDDCIVPDDWLRKIVAAFEAEPDAVLLYGQVVPFEESGEKFHQTPALMDFAPRRMSKRDGFQVFGMGANFAARRALFERVGYFDEILGGGGPLKSSQDYDITYRAYQAGEVTILRPEVLIRHDGHRAPEDWPALSTNYGFGDGAFYTKHIRCRDPYALWLATRQLAKITARWAYHKLRRQDTTEGRYLAGFAKGVRASLRYRVDRQARLYRPQDQAS
jgi:glycosyltransferase involved in cell wall biosynthesis